MTWGGGAARELPLGLSAPCGLASAKLLPLGWWRQLRAQNCMSCLIQTKKILEILGGGNTSQQPSLLHTAKINGKMLSLGDKSEVPFALPRGKCLASSPHPNLGNRLIRTLQKAKRRGLEGPFPWGHPAHQLQGRRAAALPWDGCHHFALCFRVPPSPQPLLWARSLPVPPHKAEGKMLPGSSTKAYLALPANSAPAAVNRLAGDAS